jgi:Uma2 family endonuclease
MSWRGVAFTLDVDDEGASVSSLPHDHQESYTVPYDPARLYSVEEFGRLPEDNSRLYELGEGRIVVSRRAGRGHANAIKRLLVQIDPQLPAHLDVLSEIDVDLQLSTPVVRIPDVVITSTDVFGKRGITRASVVQVAVEIISPGSVRTDTIVKPLEYADAGIPHLWLIDPHPPVTATVYRLVDGEYQESLRAEHSFQVDEPCPLLVDLDSLSPPQSR